MTSTGSQAALPAALAALGLLLLLATAADAASCDRSSSINPVALLWGCAGPPNSDALNCLDFKDGDSFSYWQGRQTEYDSMSLFERVVAGYDEGRPGQTWEDNKLCATFFVGWKFSDIGSATTFGNEYKATNLRENSWPAWNDNYLYVPHNSPLRISFSQSAPSGSGWATLNLPENYYYFLKFREPSVHWNDNHLLWRMDGCDSASTTIVYSGTKPTECQCNKGYFQPTLVRPRSQHNNPYTCAICADGKYQDVGPSNSRLGMDAIGSCKVCSIDGVKTFVAERNALEPVDDLDCFPNAGACPARCAPGYAFNSGAAQLDVLCSKSSGGLSIASTCSNINECSSAATHECPASTTCVDDAPGYHCVCQSPTCDCYGQTIQQNDVCLPEQCQPSFCGQDRSRLKRFHLDIDVEVFFIDVQPNPNFADERVAVGQIKIIAHSAATPGKPLPSVTSQKQVFGEKAQGGASLSFRIDADFSSQLPDGIPSIDKVEIQLLFSFVNTEGPVTDLVAAELLLTARDVMDMHPARFVPAEDKLINSESFRLIMTPKGSYGYEGRRQCSAWQCSGAKVDSKESNVFANQAGWLQFSPADYLRSSAREQVGFQVRSPSGSGPAPVLVVMANLFEKKTSGEPSQAQLRVPWTALPVGGIDPRALANTGCVQGSGTGLYKTCPGLGASSLGVSYFDFLGTTSSTREGVLLARDLEAAGLNSHFTFAVTYEAPNEASWGTLTLPILHSRATHQAELDNIGAGSAAFEEDLNRRRFILYATATGSGATRQETLTCCVGADCASINFGQSNCDIPAMAETWLNIACTFNATSSVLSVHASTGSSALFCSAAKAHIERVSFGPADALVLGHSPRFFVPRLGEVTTKSFSSREDSTTWQGADERCSALGGTLTTNMDSLVAGFSKSSSGEYWLGLHSLGAEDTWQWVDARPSKPSAPAYPWLNWDGDAGIDFAQTDTCGTLTALVPGGLSFHLQSCTDAHSFICELPDPEPSNPVSYLEVTTPRSWADAQAICASLASGGRLAVLSTPQLLSGAQLDLDGLDDSEHWIGFRRDDAASAASSPAQNIFVWLDGANMTQEHTAALGAAVIDIGIDPCSVISYNPTKQCGARGRLSTSGWTTTYNHCWRPVACNERRTFLCDFTRFEKVGTQTLRGHVSNVLVFRDPLTANQIQSAFKDNINPSAALGTSRLAVSGTSVKYFNTFPVEVDVNNAALYCNAFNTSVPLAAWRRLQDSSSCRPNTEAVQAPGQDDDCWEYHVGFPNQLEPDTFYELRVSLDTFASEGGGMSACSRPESYAGAASLDNCGSEIWLPFRTTCGCTVDNPTGRPALFTPFQTTTHVGFKWVDESYCEEGYNFYRGDEAVDVQYTRKGNCFEHHITDNSGDPLANNPLLSVNSEHLYCISAIGAATASDPASLYASDRVCRLFKVSFVGELDGKVVSARSDTGIANIVVTGLLLDEEERANGRIRRPLFAEHASPSARRRRNDNVDELKNGGGIARRWVVNSTCSTSPAARDGRGNLIYGEQAGQWVEQSWPEAPAGTTATLACPYAFLETPQTLHLTVERHCRADGTWAEVESSQICSDPLVFFNAPQSGVFLVQHNDEILRDLTLDECAWECVYSDNCTSFEYNPSTFSCFHSTVPPSALDASQTVDTDFATALDLQLYELSDSLPRRKDVAKPVPAPSPALTVCNMDNDAIFGGLPRDSDGERFFKTLTHLRAVSTASCGVLRGNLIIKNCDRSVAHLFYLSALVHVTGRITIDNCGSLRFFAGGLGRLTSVGSMVDEVSLRINNNPKLEGPGLRTMLATLYDTARATSGVVANNARLCIGTAPEHYNRWPGRWEFSNNASPAECGCTLSAAHNYNSTALYNDGSCQYPSCEPCMIGTSGNCRIASGPMTGICGWAADKRDCAAHSYCDPCHNVVCDQPPTSCHEPDTGVCQSGKCVYTLKAVGASCDDGVPGTGPDTCNSQRVCVGQASCTAPPRITAQAEIDALEGCGTITTDLVVDCTGSGSISSLAPLSAVHIVRGGVEFVGCGNDVIPSSSSSGTNTAPVLPILELIAGNRDRAALALVNVTWVGAPSALFPALERAVGAVEVHHSPSICINTLWHDDYTVVGDVATSTECGCTDVTALNYDATAVIDDGSCVADLCFAVVCNQTFPCYDNGTCDPVTGECLYLPLEVGTSCDDGLSFTFNDSCAAGPFGAEDNMVCSGTDLCEQDGYCEQRECQNLVGCHNGQCFYEYAEEGDPCDDNLEHTSFETCTRLTPSDPSSTVCGGEYLYKAEYDAQSGGGGRRRRAVSGKAAFDPCYLRSERNQHVLEIRDGKACEQQVAAADVAAGKGFDVGDVASFNIFKPAAGLDGRFELKVFNNVTIFPSRSLERVHRGAGALFDGTETVGKLQGQWELELEPSMRWMFENCRRACSEHVLLQISLGVPRSDAMESWTRKCGQPGLCQQPTPELGESGCVSNAAGMDAVCDRYRDRCLASTSADPMRVRARFWSHNLLRDHLLDFEGEFDVPHEVVVDAESVRNPLTFHGPGELESSDRLSFSWHTGASSAPGAHCVQVRPRASGSSAAWDNNWLCSNIDIGLEFSADGAVSGKRNIRIIEPEAVGGDWASAYLVLPPDSPFELVWTLRATDMAARTADGYASMLWLNEPQDALWTRSDRHFLQWKTSSEVHVYSLDIRPFYRFDHGVTLPDGGYELSFVSPVAETGGDDSTQVAVVYPFAITGGILHTFGTGGGQDSSLVVQVGEMEHTQKRRLSNFEDSTGYHVSGQVVFGDLSTLHSNVLALNDASKCPVSGVRVCAHVDGRTGPVACNVSTADGTWSLYVTADKDLVVRASMEGRQLLAGSGIGAGAHANVRQELEEVDGEQRATAFRIEDLEESVEDLVFLDTTAMYVSIAYGGGVCLHPIGDATFELVALDPAQADADGVVQSEGPRRSQCQLQTTVRFVASAASNGEMHVLVPAQNYSVELQQGASLGGVGELEGPQISKYFLGEGDVQPDSEQAGLARIVRFEPRLSSESESETTSVEEEVDGDGIGTAATQSKRLQEALSTEAPAATTSVFERKPVQTRALFEYHAVPQLSIDIRGTERRECAEVDDARERVYVMRTAKSYTVVVTVAELYPGASVDEPNVCKDVPGAIVVDDTISSPPRAGEFLPIEVVYQGGRALAAEARYEVVAGGPNIVAPYTKDLRVTLENYLPQELKPWAATRRGEDYGKTFALVVVEGAQKISDRLTIKVPEFVPFLILRDPPGGSSYSSFTKGQTRSLQLMVSKREHSNTYVDLGARFSSTMPLKQATCVGAPGAMTCLDGAKLVARSGLKLHSNLEINRRSDVVAAYKMSTDITYSTSASPEMVGPAADVFVSAALSIKFGLHATISVPDGSCTANRVDLDKWELGNDEDVSYEQSAKNQLLALRQVYLARESKYDEILEEAGGPTPTSINEVIDSELLHHSYWNSLASHTRYDVREKRIPQLQERVAAASQLIACKEDYDPSKCPSLKVLDSVDVPLEKAKRQFAQAAIDGWWKTLAIDEDIVWKDGKPSAGLEPLVPSSALGEEILASQLARLDAKDEAYDLTPDIEEGTQTLFEAGLGIGIGLAVATAGQSAFMTSAAAASVGKQVVRQGQKVATRLDRGGIALLRGQERAFKYANKVLPRGAKLERHQVDLMVKAAAKRSVTESKKAIDTVAERFIAGGMDAAQAQKLARQAYLLTTAFSTLGAPSVRRILIRSIAKTQGKAAGKAIFGEGGFSLSSILNGLEDGGAVLDAEGEEVVGGVTDGDLAFAEKPRGLNMPDVGTPSMLSFTGGGTSYTFHTEDVRHGKINNDISYTWDLGLGAAFDTEFTFVTGSGDTEDTILFDESNSVDTTEHERTLSSSFTLEDPDVGDEFDVEVWLDPIYNTPVFHTVSGQSMCAREAGTTPREQYSIGVGSLTAKHAKLRPTAADGYDMASDAYEFELFVANESPTKDVRPAHLFVAHESLVYADKESGDSSGMLYFRLDGAMWKSVVKNEELPTEGTMRAIVQVTRPQLARLAGINEYKGVEVRVASACEHDMWGEHGLVRVKNDWARGSACKTSACWLEDGPYTYASATFDLIFPDQSEFGGGRRRRGAQVSGSGANRSISDPVVMEDEEEGDVLAIERELGELKTALKAEHAMEQQLLVLIVGLVVVLFVVVLALHMSRVRRLALDREHRERMASVDPRDRTSVGRGPGDSKPPVINKQDFLVV